MRLLGLTGDIATGKSTVARRLAQHGAAVVDADDLVRELYAEPAFAERVVALFESHVWDGVNQRVLSLRNPAGGIDRAALGALVFADKGALLRLEALVHPAVARLRELRLQELRYRDPSPVAVVLEAVKLVESGQAAGCAAVWWIQSDATVQTKRLCEDRGLDVAAAALRLARQPDTSGKRAAASGLKLVEIMNNGSREELLAQVDTLWQKFIEDVVV